MPLIVPVLRLAMLFLNIYDSYKVLKPPPPSIRNANHPSLRAITQRKRSMKGCLAVWIVWCCYMVYERMLETLVSIFIPFYDELKSLAIIFLILTRSRGAEPIYLHIIRPFIKPHTETIDTLLDFTFLLIDIALVVVHTPGKVARDLWNRVFGRGDSTSDSEIPLEHSNSSSAEGNSHVTSHVAVPISRWASGTSSGGPIAENAGQPIESTRPHEIWYPPPSAYQDDEDDSNRFQPGHHSTPASISTDSQLTLIQELQIDEWRQCPQFPAAYPPTPLVAMMRLSSASGRTNGSTLPQINEMPKQDFRQSLSLPSEAMNPDSDSGLSDKFLKQGVHVSEDGDSMAMSVEPDSDSSTLGEDEEDEFNITLQTPLLARSSLHAIRISSRTNSLATTSSTHSRSTGLSTVHNGSPLRTRSSLDSLLSGALPSDEERPMIGKKRPLQLTGNNGNRNTKVVIGPGLDSVHAVAGDERKHKRHASSVPSSDQQNNRNDNIKESEAKKRKLESPNKISARMARPVGPRIARPAPSSARSQRKALPEQAKPQGRERAGSALRTDKPAASNNGGNFASTMSKSRPGGIVVSRSLPKKVK